jgi:hypothetical protein
MRTIIEARIEGGADSRAPIQLAEVERADGEQEMREMPEPRRFPAKRKRDDRCQRVA